MRLFACVSRTGPGTRFLSLLMSRQRSFELLERLSAYARERGVPLVEVAIGALLSRPLVSSVIAGATTPEQVSANVAAVQWRPSAEDLEALDDVLATPRERLAFAPGES